MSSKTKERKNLSKEIKELKKNIRQKHFALTQNVITLEEEREKSLKPITEPLKQLLKEGEIKREEIKQAEDVEMDDIQERLKNKRNLESPYEKTPKRPALQVPEDDNPMMQEDEQEEEEETQPTAEQVLASPEGRKSARFYKYNESDGFLVKEYMQKFFKDPKHEIDIVFGPRYVNDVLMLGKYPILFKNDDIIINDVKYEGTPGLYELIFMKHPDFFGYTEDDLSTYGEILKQTKAHIHAPTGRIKSSKSLKYTKIIRPSIMKPSSLDNASGSGLMKLNNFKPNYIYWNDVNELCERLQLLIASQNAGHTGHRNEILSIIEELHEAGVIKENASMSRLSFIK